MARWYEMFLVYEASLVYWHHLLMFLSADCSLSVTSCLVSKIGCFSQLALGLSVSEVCHVITRCRNPCKTSSTSCFGTLPHCL